MHMMIAILKLKPRLPVYDLCFTEGTVSFRNVIVALGGLETLFEAHGEEALE